MYIIHPGVWRFNRNVEILSVPTLVSSQLSLWHRHSCSQIWVQSVHSLHFSQWRISSPALSGNNPISLREGERWWWWIKSIKQRVHWSWGKDLLLNAGYMGTVLVMRTASDFLSRFDDSSVSKEKNRINVNKVIEYDQVWEKRIIIWLYYYCRNKKPVKPSPDMLCYSAAGAHLRGGYRKAYVMCLSAL